MTMIMKMMMRGIQTKVTCKVFFFVVVVVVFHLWCEYMFLQVKL